MPQDPLDEFLEHCLSVYQRLKREGSWSWPDSTDGEDLLESESNAEGP